MAFALDWTIDAASSGLFCQNRRVSENSGAIERVDVGFASFRTSRFAEERDSSPVRGTCRRCVSLDVARRGTQLGAGSSKLSAGQTPALPRCRSTSSSRSRSSQARGVSTRHLQGYLNWTEAVRKPALTECRVVLAPRASRQVGKSLTPRRE